MSNPLVFHVGQLPEVSRKPMITRHLQVLGKEELALRKRPDSEVEERITLPCTVNGQIASGEVNRYRFKARKGQRLVISTQARQLIPFIADAVPGWFQPVLALYDANGKEVAYDDDYRFKPDPVIFYEVPKDGEYVLAIYDAIYRGREDFVYRVTIGELPFVTSIFPLGGRAGDPAADRDERLEPGSGRADAAREPTQRRESIGSPPARRDSFPTACPSPWTRCRNAFEKEPNNDPAHAQKVKLPIIINGRIDRPDDWDVFQFTGQPARRSSRKSMRAGSIPRWIPCSNSPTRRASCWRSTTITKTRTPESTRTTPIPTSWPSCPPTEPTTFTSATPRATAARSMPTACASARRGPISRCASCLPASACAARAALASASM